MKISQMVQLIFVFGLFYSIASGTEIVRLKSVERNGKLFCQDKESGKTYCLSVADYPRDELEALLKGMMSHNNSDF